MKEIFDYNIAIIAIQHSKIYFVDTFGDFSYTVQWNSLKSVWQISLYIRREFFKEILYKNIAIIAIQHGKFILLTRLAIFPILLGKIHSSPYGKFPYTY